MKKILFLTDFSKASRHALRVAQALFAEGPAAFTVVNAYPLEVGLTQGAPFLVEAYHENAEEQLNALKAELIKDPGPYNYIYSFEAVPGSPEGAAVAITEQHPYDFVLVGATGAGHSEWVGSTATALSRHLKTSLLVIPESFPVRPVQHVVLTTDYQSINTPASLKPLTDLIALKKADLTLLTIQPSNEPGPATIEPTLNELLAQFNSVQVATCLIHDNDVLHGINTYLDTHTVDLLVSVPHHKGWMEALFGQSITRHLAYWPRVPLLTLYDADRLPVAEEAAPSEPDLARMPDTI